MGPLSLKNCTARVQSKWSLVVIMLMACGIKVESNIWWKMIDFINLNVTESFWIRKNFSSLIDKSSSETFQSLPKLSDIWSWFGLVNQLSSYNQLTDIVELECKVISVGGDKSFSRSKNLIIAAIEEGVIARRTCLRLVEKLKTFIIVEKYVVEFCPHNSPHPMVESWGGSEIQNASPHEQYWCRVTWTTTWWFTPCSLKQHPRPGCKQSPAQLLFSRPLNETLSYLTKNV